MYATCLFCKKSLGANETFESFPVGRRLAFDAAKGRLWVVCAHCERWNLSPLEERWEAIEHAERLYRDTRKRVATDNIGLAKLRDGTTLVRIGAPLRPEFAAWRYGDQFGRRRNRQLLIAGAGVAALTGVVVGGMVTAGGIGGMGWIIAQLGQRIVRGSPEEVIAKVPTSSHGVVHVRRRHLGETIIGQNVSGEMAIDLRFKNGSARFEGREAERVAAMVIPTVNRFGGSKARVAEAVDEIERVGGPEGYLAYVAGAAHAWTDTDRASSPRRRGRFRSTGYDWSFSHGLYALAPAHRLALEMALHEESERRAMTGELEQLEEAWRSAEEIAGIADNLLLPDAVTAKLGELRSHG
jgi:hypothetical protein